ncbi:MAG: gliding motility-associated C-terminal domain-containing protein, partial [Segetibacter sp.]|nr:gliding motility-associated C-terminal domain-containing protein [Segetibacter sp.]
PEVCYRIDRYVTTVELPSSTAGYTLAVQRCCRIAGIVNVTGSSNIGVSYTTSIPGTINGINFEKNNSPQFVQRDTVMVCYNGSFTFDFSATDTDGDSLTYSFCPGLVGGGPGMGQSQPNPPSSPPYSNVPYSSSFSGDSPMGPSVTVDPKTGLISGQAPARTGDYVVAVCASEFRNGVKIGETKKEIHITVANCSLAAAELRQPGYQLCDSLTATFQNLSTASNIISYTWNFADPASGANNTSTGPVPTHTYSDTGIYNIKLKVQSSAGCTDSTTSVVKVYPGFNPDFSITGSCFQTPFQFQDKTTTRYGVVDSWKWDFGDLSSNADVSTLKNPTYQYATPGARTARLIVTNSKGCIDTISKPVAVNDIPALRLPFKDTLICSVDTLPLQSIGNGIFTWTPNYNIINGNTANPLVYPKTTTSYVVTLNELGCIKKDTIKVNVLDFITVDAGRDTSICRTDSITIRTQSQGLQYAWTPATGLNNIATRNPVARPLNDITYFVTANLGKCQAKDSIRIKVTPYPQANAGTDASICFGDQTQIQATITGSRFTWSPANSLQNSTTLNPVAAPSATTSYLLAVFDTLGCPKPSVDTVVVKVTPQVKAFAGNDTIVVANQPLQLNATGGSNYLWSPATGISDPNILNPVITLGTSVDSITYRVKVSVADGCFAEDDIKVRIFKTGPDIFVPTAFTPNGDGKNDLLKPIPVGIKSMEYFRVYNRWGSLVFSTRQLGAGWDGTIEGKQQTTGTFVYMTAAIDYLGNTITKKGTVVLIR